LLGKSFVIDLYGIVGSASSGLGFIRDQTGITNTTYVYSISLPVIVAPKFTGIFTDSIDGSGFDDGMLRTIDPRGAGAKDSN
jgi:hypothetical protein